MNNLAADWDIFSFQSVVKKVIDFRGRTPLKIGMDWGNGEILSLSANNVKQGYIDKEKEAHLGSIELYNKWMTRGECKLGDIVFTMEAPLGNVAQIPDNHKYILSQRVILLKINDEVANSTYIAYLMSGDDFQIRLLQRSTGSTVTGIQQQKLNKFELVLPLIQQQNKIAKVLSTVDNLIDKTQNLIGKYTAVKQGMMTDLFTRGIDLTGTPETNENYGQLRPSIEEAPELYQETELGWTPKEWSISDLKQSCSSIGDGVHYSVKRVDEGIPFLFVSCIKNGDIQWGKAACISQKTYEEISKNCKPYEGLILFTAVGSYGQVAYVRSNKPFGFERNIAYLKPINSIVNSRFLFYSLQTHEVMSQVESLVMGNAQKLISLGNLGRIVVRIPKESEQIKIYEKLDLIGSQIKNEKKSLDKYKSIKKGLMQDLLTGKVKVN
jgi:type I restriction enzyme S subunit